VRLRFDPVALAELEDLLRYLEAENPTAARPVVARILQCIRRLETFPRMGRPSSAKGTRVLTVPGLPYVVVYRYREDMALLEVLSVFHGARDRAR